MSRLSTHPGETRDLLRPDGAADAISGLALEAVTLSCFDRVGSTEPTVVITVPYFKIK